MINKKRLIKLLKPYFIKYWLVEKRAYKNLGKVLVGERGISILRKGYIKKEG